MSKLKKYSQENCSPDVSQCWYGRQACSHAGKLIAYEACSKGINQREIIGLESKCKFTKRKLVNDNKVKHKERKPVKYY